LIQQLKYFVSQVSIVPCLPVKPGAGTRMWNGTVSFRSRALYTCGPYGKFQATPTSPLYEEQDSVCAWNKSWVPEVLPDCVSTSCPDVPFPPSFTGLIYRPDAKNNITLNSGIFNNIFKYS
jgi:hypothetical protein